MSRCIYVLENGEQCKGFALKNDSLCYFHSQKTKKERALAQRRGGKVCKGGFQEEIEIKSSFDVTALLNYVVNELKSGRLDSKTANSLIYACNMHLKALEVHEIQQKLGEIHKQMEQNQAWNAPNYPDADLIPPPENRELPEADDNEQN